MERTTTITPKIKGYACKRAGRKGAEFHGGGLLTYISDNLAFKHHKSTTIAEKSTPRWKSRNVDWSIFRETVEAKHHMSESTTLKANMSEFVTILLDAAKDRSVTRKCNQLWEQGPSKWKE